MYETKSGPNRQSNFKALYLKSTHLMLHEDAAPYLVRNTEHTLLIMFCKTNYYFAN